MSAVFTLAVAATALGAPNTVLAQEQTAESQDSGSDGQPSPGTVRLVAQTASVESDGNIDVTLDWDGELQDDLFLSVLFHQRIDSERDVGAPTTTVLNRRDAIPLTEMPTDVDGNLVLTIPVRSISPAADDRAYLPGPGVYPFTVQVRSSEGLVSAVSSTVVRLPQDRAELATLDFAVILALSPADGLDLSDGLWFLSTYPEVPFTVQIDEGVLTQLEGDEALADQFALAADGRPVITDAGFDLDPSALAEIEQGRFYTEGLAATAQRLTNLGLSPLSEVVMLASDITAPGAELIIESGVLAALSTRSQEIDTGAITTAAGRLQIIQSDRQLTEELSAPQGFGTFVPSDIYALYARLSLRANEDSSAVIMGGEGAPVLDSQSLDAFLATLTEDGPLRPVPLLDALTSQPRNPLLAAERPEQNLLDSGEAISELQQLAQTSRSFRGVQNPALEQLLVDSLSKTRNPTDRARAIERAKAELLSDLATVSLPSAQSLTLAAVEGPLPLTIRNDADSSRLVRLQFRGDRVEIEQDGQVFAIPPGETTIELTARARALGVSTLEVTATTPDQSRVLSTSRYQIRSTAVPGLGWAISGAALAFLLLWWFRNSRRSTPNRPHLVGVRDTPESSEQPPRHIAAETIAAETIAADTAEAL
ncbi:MAG: hypothetical protein ACN4GZ_02175 [Acidimicrobiales bacterium]